MKIEDVILLVVLARLLVLFGLAEAGW